MALRRRARTALLCAILGSCGAVAARAADPPVETLNPAPQTPGANGGADAITQETLPLAAPPAPQEAPAHPQPDASPAAVPTQAETPPGTTQPQPAAAPDTDPNAPTRSMTGPVTDCDRLAQPPRKVMDPASALAEGVDYSELRWPIARAVCLRAIADFPDQARFVAYLGRAADKSGDVVEAARLYRFAADAGNAMAQNNLAAMYEDGDARLPRNGREAVRLYKLAAAQFYPDAQTSLAQYYATGAGGLKRDDQEAVRLWQFTAVQDDPIAQYGLGRMYAEGRGGLTRDIDEAVRLWRLAAAGGSTEAKAKLRRYPKP